ncbi:hypothetical protein CAPTEDRAFT_185797 [Capitella teleta]|uniref:Peptidase A2 domain-containing protein n=1 Tax=Capitella teleta TaxID=283909 RepID=R7URI6_CAPTE|nr:hypothetical protein CAPTEDRAFT_185797 [Capitella teleta]|eukprot:ELU06522.1 hypothetical protein CAPTEDRAFT_185797 [Capitella teleta]
MYVRALHETVEKCAFDANQKEEQLRDRLVVGLRDKVASRDLQLKERLTLSEAVTFARQAEAVKVQIGLQRPLSTSGAIATATPSAVEETRKGYTHMFSQKNFKKGKPKQQRDDQLTNCSRTGHFALCCSTNSSNFKSKPLKKVPEVYEEWYVPEVIDVVLSSKNAPWMVKLRTEGQSIQFKIDSGTDVSVITPQIHRQLKQPTLTSSTVRLRGAGGAPLKCLGWFQTTVRRKGHKFKLKLFVVEGASNNLLSRRASIEMDLIHLQLNEAIEDPGVYGDIGLMTIKPVKIRLCSVRHKSLCLVPYDAIMDCNNPTWLTTKSDGILIVPVADDPVRALFPTKSENISEC